MEENQFCNNIMMDWLNIGTTYQPITSLVAPKVKVANENSFAEVKEEKEGTEVKRKKKEKKEKKEKKKKSTKKRKHEHEIKDRKKRKKEQDSNQLVPNSRIGPVPLLIENAENESSFDSNSSDDDDTDAVNENNQSFHEKAVALFLDHPDTNITYLPNGQLILTDRNPTSNALTTDMNLTWSIDRRKDVDIFMYLGVDPKETHPRLLLESSNSKEDSANFIILDSLTTEEEKKKKKSFTTIRKEKEEYLLKTANNKTDQIFYFRNSFQQDLFDEKPEKMKKEERYFPSLSFSSSSSSASNAIMNNQNHFHYLLNPISCHFLITSQPSAGKETSERNFFKSEFLPLPVVTHELMEEKLQAQSLHGVTIDHTTGNADSSNSTTDAKEASAFSSALINYYTQRISFSNPSSNDLSTQNPVADDVMLVWRNATLMLHEYLHIFPFISYLQEIGNGNYEIMKFFPSPSSSFLFLLNEFQLNAFFQELLSLKSSSKRMKRIFSLLQERGLLEKRIYYLQQAIVQLLSINTNLFTLPGVQMQQSLQLNLLEYYLKLLHHLLHYYPHNTINSSLILSSPSSSSTASFSSTALLNSSLSSLEIIEEIIRQYQPISYRMFLQFHSFYYLSSSSSTAFDRTSHVHYSEYILKRLVEYPEKVKNYCLLQSMLSDPLAAFSSNVAVPVLPSSAARHVPVASSEDNDWDEEQEDIIAFQVIEGVIDQLYLFLKLEWNHYQHVERIVAFLQSFVMLNFPHSKWSEFAGGKVTAELGFQKLEEYWESEDVRVGEVTNTFFFPHQLQSSQNEKVLSVVSSSEVIRCLDVLRQEYGSFCYNTVLDQLTLSNLFPVRTVNDNEELIIEQVIAEPIRHVEEPILVKEKEKEKEEVPEELQPRYVYSRIHGYKIWIIPEDTRTVYKKILSEINLDTEDPLTTKEELENAHDDTNASEIAASQKSSRRDGKSKFIKFDYSFEDVYLLSYYYNYFHSLIQYLPLRSSFIPSHYLRLHNANFKEQAEKQEEGEEDVVKVKMESFYYEQLERQPERVIFFNEIKPLLELTLLSPHQQTASLDVQQRCALDKIFVRVLLRLFTLCGLHFPWCEGTSSSFLHRHQEKLHNSSNFIHHYDFQIIFQRLQDFVGLSEKESISANAQLKQLFHHYHSHLNALFDCNNEFLKQNYQMNNLQGSRYKETSFLVFLQRIVEYVIIHYHQSLNAADSFSNSNERDHTSSFFYFRFISQLKDLLIGLYYQQYQYEEDALSSANNETLPSAVLTETLTAIREKAQQIIQLSIAMDMNHLPRKVQAISVVGDLNNWSYYLRKEYAISGYSGTVKMIDKALKAISTQISDTYLRYNILPTRSQHLSSELVASISFYGIIPFYSTSTDLLFQSSYSSLFSSDHGHFLQSWMKVTLLLTQFAFTGILWTERSTASSEDYYRYGLYSDLLKDSSISSKKKPKNNDGGWTEVIMKYATILKTAATATSTSSSDSPFWSAIRIYHQNIMEFFAKEGKKLEDYLLNISERPKSQINLDTVQPIIAIDDTPEIFHIIQMMITLTTLSTLFDQITTAPITRSSIEETFTKANIVRSVQAGEKVYETVLQLIYSLLTKKQKRAQHIESVKDRERSSQSHPYLTEQQTFQYYSLFYPLSKVVSLLQGKTTGQSDEALPFSWNIPSPDSFPRSITAMEALGECEFTILTERRLLLLYEKLLCARVDYLLSWQRFYLLAPQTQSFTSEGGGESLTSELHKSEEQYQQHILSTILIGLHHFPLNRSLLELLVSYQYYCHPPPPRPNIIPSSSTEDLSFSSPSTNSTSLLAYYYCQQYFQHYLPLSRHYWNYEMQWIEIYYQFYSELLSIVLTSPSYFSSFPAGTRNSSLFPDWKQWFRFLQCHQWKEEDYDRIYRFLLKLINNRSDYQTNAMIWRWLIYFILYRHVPILWTEEEPTSRSFYSSQKLQGTEKKKGEKIQTPRIALEEVKLLIQRAIYLHPYCKDLYSDIIGLLKPLFEDGSSSVDDTPSLTIRSMTRSIEGNEGKDQVQCKEIDSLLYIMEEQGIYLKS